MLLSVASRSGFAPQQPAQQPPFRSRCASKSRSPCANGLSQLVPLSRCITSPLRHARWRCRSTVGSSRPAPGDEPLRPGDTPDAQAEAPSTNHTKDAAADGRRKGLALLGELKELVESCNAELKAELLQQFALLQQADVEAKRRQEHAHSTSVSMHGTISNQVEEVQQQLEGVLSGRGSTEQLLRQVLGEVQELRLQQQQQQQVDACTVQHASAAAASAEAVQQKQQQKGELAGESKAQPLQGTHADIRRVALLQQSMASELQELLQTSKSSWEGHQASIDGLYATVLQLRSQQGTDSHAIKQAVQTSATSTTAATHMQQAALLKSIQALMEGATQEILASQAKAVAEAAMQAATAAAEATAAAAAKAARQGAAGAGGTAAGPTAEAAPTVEELVREAKVTFTTDGTSETLKAEVLKEAAHLVHQNKDAQSIANRMKDFAKETYGNQRWQCTVFAEGQGGASTTYRKTCFRWIMGPWEFALWRVDD